MQRFGMLTAAATSWSAHWAKMWMDNPLVNPWAAMAAWSRPRPALAQKHPEGETPSSGPAASPHAPGPAASPRAAAPVVAPTPAAAAQRAQPPQRPAARR
jgi:hypothetical protein